MADFARLENLFFGALTRTDSEERQRYLDAECGQDDALREQVERLLAGQVAAGSFLEKPASSEATQSYAAVGESDSNREPELVGSQVGPYTLLQKLGEGGMGTVWVAEQVKPVKRRVALKLIKTGMDSAQVIRRFEAERQALALMDHTNIAKVLDAGTTSNGRPYFVMELVKGVPITRYCDEVHASIRNRLELYVQVCSAVQHAHQKGIIHRDIKPSNILIAMQDGKPVPKVIDFGVAKALHSKLADKTMYTEIGQIIGTLEYMAPEQAELSAMDIDTRADIYALGVLLYELLTGSTPITRERMKSAAFAEVIRLIKEEEPQKPSTRLTQSKESLANLAALRKTDPKRLSIELKGELDWVVLKALEKDRTCRYETANGLARDIQRYLADEVIEAKSPSAGYRLRKFVRRHKGQVIAAGAVAAVLVVGLVATSYGFFRADQERIRANAAEQSAVENASKAMDAAAVARQRLDDVNAAHRKLEAEQDSRARADYGWSILTANTASKQYRFDTANTFLNRTKPEFRRWEWHYLHRLCRGDELYALRGKSETILFGEFSPDGRQIATLSTTTRDISTAHYSIEIWDVVTRQSFTLHEGPAPIRVFQFSSDGQKLLVTQWDKVSLWDIPSRTETVLFVADAQTRFWDGRFSPDGRRIVTSGWVRNNIETDEIEVLAVWDIEKRERIWSQKRRGEVCLRISYSGDGRWIIGTFSVRLSEDASQGQRVIRFWDAESGAELLEIKNGTQSLWGAVLSPDASRVAVSGYEAGPKVWRVRREGNRPVLDGDPIVLRGHAGIVGTAAFSPDGSLLATTADDRTIRIWDAATGAELRVLAGHSGWVSSIRFSPNGRCVLTTSGDGTARVWDAHRADPQVIFRDARRLFGMDLSPAGDRMLVYDRARTWGIYDLGTGRRLPYTIPGSPARFSPDGKRIATLVESADRTADKIGVYDADTGRLLREYQRKLGLGARFTFSADGSRLLIPGDSRRVTVWEIETGRTWELGEGDKKGFAGAEFSPDGSKIFLDRSGDQSSHQTGISILDGESYKPLVDLETAPVKYSNWYRSFSRDGRKFLAYYIFPDSTPNECRIWDTTTGRLLRSFRFPAEFRSFVQLSPDGSRIFISDWDGRLRMVDADTGDELLALLFPALQSVAFDRTGHKMIVASTNEVRILDGTPLPEAKK